MSDRSTELLRLVELLCSPECGGRQTATKESEAARGRIIDEMKGIGLEPAGTRGFEQPVPASKGANVIGRLPGRGALADRAVLVAAHYDHLGWESKGVAYWGADDNAAAVGVMIDVARHLYSRPVASHRQVLFVAFDAEEPPFFLSNGMGSMHFVREPTVPLSRIDAMVCMDLVGHALGSNDLAPSIRESLFVLGAEKGAGLAELVDAAGARARGVRPRRLAVDVVPSLSDYHAFQLHEVPFVFLTCGRWRHYHMTTDTPEKLDYAKCIATADFLADLVRGLAERPVASVGYDAGARDDLASIASLEALAAELGGHPLRRDLAAAAGHLRSLLDPSGQLRPEGQVALGMIIGTMEDELAGE